MGKTTKNATVAAVQQSIQQQASANVKNVLNNSNLNSKPAMARPTTPANQKAAMPVAAKPAAISKASTPAPKSLGNKNPLAPLTPGKAAAGLPDNVFGNMFDLPPKWVAACKPAQPVHRSGAAAPQKSLSKQNSFNNNQQQQSQKSPIVKQASATAVQKPQQKQQQKQQQQQQFHNAAHQKFAKAWFAHQPRGSKNSTDLVFNISFLYPETKFANCAPVAPKRVPGGRKPAGSNASSRPVSAPSTPKPVARPHSPSKASQQKQHNTSAVDWQTNIWEDFFTANKHHTFIGGKAPPAKPAAPKAAPNVNTKRPVSAPGKKNQHHESLKSHIPPPKEAKSPEIFSFLH